MIGRIIFESFTATELLTVGFVTTCLITGFIGGVELTMADRRKLLYARYCRSVTGRNSPSKIAWLDPQNA